MEKETRWSRRDGNKRSLRPNWNGTQQERERDGRGERAAVRTENKMAVDDDDVECHRKLDGRNEFSFHAEVRKKTEKTKKKEEKEVQRQRWRHRTWRPRHKRERERERIYDDFIVLRGLAVGTYSRLFIDATGSPLAFFILFFLFFFEVPWMNWFLSSMAQ